MLAIEMAIQYQEFRDAERQEGGKTQEVHKHKAATVNPSVEMVSGEGFAKAKDPNRGPTPTNKQWVAGVRPSRPPQATRHAMPTVSTSRTCQSDSPKKAASLNMLAVVAMNNKIIRSDGTRKRKSAKPLDPNLTPEERERIEKRRAAARERKRKSRANQTEEKKEEERKRAREGMAKRRLAASEEQKDKWRGEARIGMALSRKRLRLSEGTLAPDLSNVKPTSNLAATDNPPQQPQQLNPTEASTLATKTSTDAEELLGSDSALITATNSPTKIEGATADYTPGAGTATVAANPSLSPRMAVTKPPALPALSEAFELKTESSVEFAAAAVVNLHEAKAKRLNPVKLKMKTPSVKKSSLPPKSRRGKYSATESDILKERAIRRKMMEEGGLSLPSMAKQGT